MHRRRLRLLAPVLVGCLAVLAVLGAVAWRDRVADQRFDLLRWEIDAIPNRWLALAAAPFREELEDDAAIASYFALTPGDPARQRLENAVERVIEGRVDTVLREMELSARVGLPATRFPPVDIELAISPQVLVVSPRSVIERQRADLLRPDLSPEASLAIEEDAEAGDDAVSALVVGSGGVATYPAIVSDRSSYRATVHTAAHEWAHHYLAFYPLGFRYFASADLRTINETVADLLGEEVAAAILERWGDPTQRAAAPAPAGRAVTGSGAPAMRQAVDASAVLRELRIEVDALLANGRVEEAERRMDAVRDELEAAGVVIRRINQAFFAWYGTYAARPDAVDPLGGQLRELRERSGSPAAFMAIVRDVGARADVEVALERLRKTQS